VALSKSPVHESRKPNRGQSWRVLGSAAALVGSLSISACSFQDFDYLENGKGAGSQGAASGRGNMGGFSGNWGSPPWAGYHPGGYPGTGATGNAGNGARGGASAGGPPALGGSAGDSSSTGGAGGI
jgi:hypothetical protein